ncbi:hypothetical protein ACJDU8_16405 [Clostridium sp. WILCCON 0269]|uniref:Uncharacterized protein n=1 Tax=Candidatus Clostridium eludens TaxID=3381663 RepID=A0ABW8SMU6_9CLOT
MKGLRIIYILIPLIIIVLLVVIDLGITRDKFGNIQSIDLGSEHINGVSLMEKPDLNLIKKAFGKSKQVTLKDTNTKGYSFNSEKCVGVIALDKNDKVISIALSTLKNTLNTGKGIISNKSSFNDIIKAYGPNYLKTVTKDTENGNREVGYSVTYTDKQNNFKLEFDILKLQSKEEIQYIRLWKYK